MNKRGAGVLLHVTSLPSPYGVGDLGPAAYEFVDFLERSGQSFWQILPLTPTLPVYGNSPYSSTSTFAGNTLLISPAALLQDGLIQKSFLDDVPEFLPDRCDYSAAIEVKEKVLRAAHEGLTKSGEGRDRFNHFCIDNASWLNDYSLFVSLKQRFGGSPWSAWPVELRDRVPEALDAAMAEDGEAVEKEKFTQFLFFLQWDRLKKYANSKGIQIIGDIPIYVSHDSVDVWSNPSIFKIDGEKRAYAVAGVPPDYFSATGQLWGNPVYNWDALRDTRYSWWIERMKHILGLYDVVRIDHFRGLIAFWEVPGHEENAINGRWVEVPTEDFFNQLFKRFFSLPLIAEDLGLITPDVKAAISRFGFPGMKVLLFAFGDDNPMHVYLPHTFDHNCVVYTGTHDNNTVKGWFDHEARPEDKQRFFRYAGKETTSKEAAWEMIRLAFQSVAKMAIVPMQDILGLGVEAQMNRPSVAHGNWEWRLPSGNIDESVITRLRTLTEIYGRK
jgi:4-alpha-glucanotransferase